MEAQAASWKFSCSWGSSWLSQGHEAPPGFLCWAFPSVSGQVNIKRQPWVSWLWLPVRQQPIRHSWLVVVVGTDSKASLISKYLILVVFQAVVRNPSVVERPNSTDTRTLGLCTLLCVMPLIWTKEGFAGSCIGTGRCCQHCVLIRSRKTVSFVHLNTKATQKFSVFLQKLNPASF